MCNEIKKHFPNLSSPLRENGVLTYRKDLTNKLKMNIEDEIR